jgi:putative methionine-R-sulfoxide reductase with GAF domain
MDHDAKAASDTGDRLLAAVADIPFDLLIFFEHGRDDEYGKHKPLFCPRLVVKPRAPVPDWSQRWQPVLPDMENWALSDAPWVTDLPILARETAARTGVTIAELPGVQWLLHQAMRALLCLGIVDGDDFVGSLMLCAHEAGTYREAERDLLHDGQAEAAAREFLAARRRRLEALIHEMCSSFIPSLAPDALAKRLTRWLVEELAWDYVGIYRVETQFALVAESDGTGKGLFNVGSDYRQSLDRGLLGSTLHAGTCLRIDDVTEEPPPHGYVTLPGLPARSALCYPIKVGGRIEWLFDCESVDFSAFRGPDKKLLDRIVEGLQSVLDLWFEFRLCNAVLDGLLQPVLVADRQGLIQRDNQQARDLLGFPGTATAITGCPADYAADEASRALFSPLNYLLDEPVRLRVATGEVREMLVSARLSDRTFGRWVLQFADPEDQRMTSNLEFARETVEAVATQARGPLMLAGTLVRRMRIAIEGGDQPAKMAETLRRIEESIARADVSYDRLARALSGKEQIGLAELLARVRAVLPANVRLNLRDVVSEAVRCDGQTVSKALAAVLRRPAQEGDRLAFDISSEVRGDSVCLDLKPVAGWRFPSLWPPNWFAANEGVMLDDDHQFGPAEAGLSELDRLRWVLAADGGQVSTTSAGLEVQLQRAATVRSEESPK